MATRRSTGTATASTIALKALGKAPALVPALAVQPACSPAWACLQFRD